MKITERLALLKAGYTKDEINAMIDEDHKADDLQPEEAPAENDKLKDYIDVISALAGEVKDLKAAVYKKNIQETEVTPVPAKSAEDILIDLFSSPKKED